MTSRRMAGVVLVFVAVFATGAIATAATASPDNSNTCPAFGKAAKGTEKRPCRPGSTHKITIGVGGKYTPAVGVQSRCLTPDQEAQYVKDRGASCTVEYCTPAAGGKEKCTKKTVKIDLGKPDPYGGLDAYTRQAQADGARLAAYTAMNDTAAAYRAGDLAKVQEIANQTKANPEVSALINNAFSSIKPSAGGNAASTMSDQEKLNAVIASLDPEQSDAKQSSKNVVAPPKDSIAVDVTFEKDLPKDKNAASAPCPTSAPCNSATKSTAPASTFSPTTETNKKPTTVTAPQGSWLGSVTNKVSDYLPASVNRWLGLANPPVFRPYDPQTDVQLLVKEDGSNSLKDKLHLDPFDTASPVVLMHKDVSVTGDETALQVMTKRQSQAVQTADFDPDTPVPSGGIVVTPLDANGQPDIAGSKVMEVEKWRDFLNEVKGNDKYNNTVISVNIPASEKKAEAPAGVDVVTTPFNDLPASVKEMFQKQDVPNKIAPPQVADNPPPGTDSPTMANNTPAGSLQNEIPKESPVPPAPQPPMPTVEESSPPVPTPLPEPTILPPAPPEKEEQPPAQPKEPPKPEEPKPEEKPVEPPVPVLSSPTKSAESIPTPLPEPELKDKLPTSESTAQSRKDEIEECKGNIDCRLKVVRKWLDDLERPKVPPVVSSLTAQSSPSSRNDISNPYPSRLSGESNEDYDKRIDAWRERSSSQSIESFIDSRGGRVGQCVGCHNPQMGGGAGPQTDYNGVGIRIQYERKELDGKQLPGGMVVSVFPNTPAERAGLRAGDFLLSLDRGQTSMISGFKGSPGTSIEVKYIPQGATAPRTITVTRAVIRCSVYGCP